MFASLRDIRIPSAPRLWLPGRSTPVKKRLHVTHAHSYQTDRSGDIIWVEDGWQHNILHDEGEQAILSAYFDTDLAGYGAPPASLYIGLDNRAALAETDTLGMAGFNEPTSAGGYARQAVSTATGFTLSETLPYYKATSSTVAFTASGAAFSTTVVNRFLCTVSSGTVGKLIASLPLSTARTVNTGDTLNTSLVIGLSE